MRSVVFDAFGTPSDVLTLAERDMPQPGPGQIRVKMVMSPIHNHDLMIISGKYGYKPELPAVPGTEAVGVVDALGDGVTRLAVGQRVTIGGAEAAWAEYFLADANKAVPLPDAVSDEVACQLIAMPLSALIVLNDLDVKSGDWIIQNTANGAVGKTLAMLATARGVNVVNLVRRDAGVAELEALGIANAVSTASEGWEARVTELTGGAPIIRAIDSIGGAATDAIMNTLAEGGMLMSFGAMSLEPLQISAANLLFKRATVKGFWGAKRTGELAPEEMGKLIGELVTMAATGVLKLPVEKQFDIADAGKAAAASDVPGRAGKIVLTA